MLQMTSIDWTILYWIQENLKCTFLDQAALFFSALGNGGAVWVFTACILIYTKKYRRYGFIILLAMLIGLCVGNGILKHTICRLRPCWQDQTMELLINRPTGYSFPSGHALSSTIAATILYLANSKFAIAAIPLVLAIAFSRLYLFVHFPSDILSGILLGTFIGWLSVRKINR